MNFQPGYVDFPEYVIAAIQADVATCLRSGRLTLGPFGARFEELLAQATGRASAVAVSSGTAALELAFRTLQPAQGPAHVLLPTNTYIATAVAAIRAGYRLTLVDSDSCGLGMAPEQVAKAMGAKGGKSFVLCVVHIGGYLAPGLMELAAAARDGGVPLLEDAAHALGSSGEGHPAGGFGDAGSFSFYPTKVVTSAEGGAVVTDSRDAAEAMCKLRDHAKQDFHTNVHGELSYSWRLGEAQAIIGFHHLADLGRRLDHRRSLAQEYDRRLAPLRDLLAPISVPLGHRPNYYKYIVRLREGLDKRAFVEGLRQRGIPVGGDVYAVPLHLQPALESLHLRKGDFPEAEAFAADHVCLPLGHLLQASDVASVVNAIEEVGSSLQKA